MSISTYQGHPLRNTVHQLLLLQMSPALVDPVIADNEQLVFARDKIFSLALVLQSLIDETPALLVSSSALNQLNKHVQSALNEINAFVVNKNIGHITNAASIFEQNVFALLWAFAPTKDFSDKSPLPELFNQLSKSSSETIRRLAEERDSLSIRVQETATQANELKMKLDGMSESAARERAESTAAIAKLEHVFTEKEIERSSTFEMALSKVRSDYAALEQATKQQAEALVDVLEDQKNKAAQIVQVVGNIGVTGNYQRIATEEAYEANFWRWATVVFFSCGVILACATFYRFWGEPITSESIWAIAVRLLYAVAITAPAWYTAKESARHRTSSDRARQTELELASLGPFIELLPPDKKMEIREQMTKLYFGREVTAHMAKPPLDAEVVKDIAIELAKAFKK